MPKRIDGIRKTKSLPELLVIKSKAKRSRNYSLLHKSIIFLVLLVILVIALLFIVSNMTLVAKKTIPNVAATTDTPTDESDKIAKAEETAPNPVTSEDIHIVNAGIDPDKLTSITDSLEQAGYSVSSPTTAVLEY